MTSFCYNVVGVGVGEGRLEGLCSPVDAFPLPASKELLLCAQGGKSPSVPRHSGVMGSPQVGEVFALLMALVPGTQQQELSTC